MRDPDRRARRLSPSPSPAGLAFALLAVLTLAAGCSPPFESSKERMVQRVNARKEARGAWLTLQDRGQKPPRELAGELLAASADSIYLLADGHLTTLPTPELQKVVLSLYEAPSQVFGKPVLVIHGALSARSHTMDAASPKGEAAGPVGGRWHELVPYARFPQGLPANFDRGPVTTH